MRRSLLVLLGALAFVYFACSGKVERLVANINVDEQPLRLLALETSDAVADVAVFFGSLTTGALQFANDPSNVR